MLCNLWINTTVILDLKETLYVAKYAMMNILNLQK